jgi:hypothetical protein
MPNHLTMIKINIHIKAFKVNLSVTVLVKKNLTHSQTTLLQNFRQIPLMFYSLMPNVRVCRYKKQHLNNAVFAASFVLNLW